LAGVGMLAGLMVVARGQARYWRDSETLWAHALECTTRNALAESNLGNALFHSGQPDLAMIHCQKAIDLDPDQAYAHHCLALALVQKEQIQSAIPHFQAALKTLPNAVNILNNYGLALMRTGHLPEAIEQFQKALAADPNEAGTCNNLATALQQSGRVAEAIAHYEKALALNPDSVGACQNLAWVLATCPDAGVRNGPRAVELARRALAQAGTPNSALLRTLAAAYAEAGRFPEAIQAAEQAIQLAEAQSNPARSATLRAELELYRDNQPLREQKPTP
jgi:tetratricopeptide (TPR) repeat protein